MPDARVRPQPWDEAADREARIAATVERLADLDVPASALDPIQPGWAVRTDRRWPRWWCWLSGHTPTEPRQSMRHFDECRCGRVEMGREEILRGPIPAWWRRFVARLP